MTTLTAVLVFIIGSSLVLNTQAMRYPKVCRTEKGEVVQNGESFKDDCNTCFCTADGQAPPTIGCTLMACMKGCTRESDGHIFFHGQSYQPDSCNTCTCQAEGVAEPVFACTMAFCP